MIKTALPLAIAVLALAACDNATKAPEGGSAASVGGATAPAGTKWSETFSATPDGGMLKGNPNAGIKLVEYGALSCSHCAEFAEASRGPLTAMIDKGNVSYEFRPFLLNVLDVPAALAARCGGPGPFFPISDQLFAAQAEWLGKAQTITPAEQQSWGNMAPEQLAPLLAAKLGIDQFVQARGIGAEQLKACLTDRAAIDKLGEISQRAQTEFKVSGTPTFVINGQTVPNTADWKTLEPKLKEAGA
jgi:protein-disulfide isomerase